MRPFIVLRRVIILLAACGLASTLSAQISISTGPNGATKGNPGSGVLGEGTCGKTARGAIHDDATARREAMREWYGVYTPEYRQFLMETAKRERERWGSLIPGNRLYEPARAAGNHWTNLGPTNAAFQINGSTNINQRDSGRPVAIVIDPNNSNTIYNATSGGGVWKTTNGGTTWTPITEAIGSLSCGDLAMDPSNSNTLYLGLGHFAEGTGVGMLKTIDGGANWTGPVFLGSSTVINSVKVSPTDPNVVLAATNTGLFRSANANGGLGGGSFSPIALGALVNPNCWSLAYAGGTNWVISVTTGRDATTNNWNGVKLFYSSDDGVTWNAATGFAATGGRTTLASAPLNRQMLYAMVALDTAAAVYSWNGNQWSEDLQQFYRSSDGGHTWTSLSLDTNVTYSNSAKADYPWVAGLLSGQGWFNQLLLVDPADSTTLWAGGALLLCKVTGATSTPVYTVMSNWLAQFSMPYIHADFHAGVFAPDGTLYMGTDGGIFKRTSAGSNTWTSDLNIGITSHLFYSVGSSPNNTAAVIGGLQDNGTRVRVGSTGTFNQTLGGDGFGSHIHQVDATKMIATSYSSQVYKSIDSGGTWTAATGISDSYGTVFNTKVVPGLAAANGNTLYTLTRAKVFKSTNYGTSFSALSQNGIVWIPFRNIGSAPSDGNVVGIVASGDNTATNYFVYTTTDGGTNWTARTSPPNNGAYMSYISFAKAQPETIYVASVAPDATKNHLWMSSNGGGAWTKLDENGAGGYNGFPFGVPVNSIVEDPGDSQTLYAGTNLGVYRSINGGATWARFGSGLPLVNVTDFYITPNSSLMRISTFGRGIWEFDASPLTVTITAPASDGLAFVHGSPITFTGTATNTGGGTLTYSWNFGDGSTATGASTSHAYFNYAGFDVTYYATLTVSSSTGGSVSTTRTVKVHTAPPATAITITANQSSAANPPNFISPVTFTAVGSGSLNTPPSGYKYQFWVRYPAASLWTMVQDFGPGTFVLTAPLGLNYGVGVDVRTSAYPLAPNNWDVFTAINHFNIALTNLRGPVSEPAAGHVPQVDLTRQLKEPMTFEQFHQFRRMIEVPQPQPTAPPTQY